MVLFLGSARGDPFGQKLDKDSTLGSRDPFHRLSTRSEVKTELSVPSPFKFCVLYAMIIVSTEGCTLQLFLQKINYKMPNAHAYII